MKGVIAGFLLLGSTASFAQPDPRDSVIIESKTVAPNLTGSPAFTLKVYITNKDTLANFTLPVEIKTVSGTAFVLLNSPRSFNGTINRLTSTLGNNTVFSSFVNDASPDSAIWSGFWDPNDTSTAEPPNFSRKAIWEIKFSHSSDSAGQVQIDSAVIFSNRVRFVGIGVNSVKVNLVKSIVSVSSGGCVITNCGSQGGNLLYGRSYSYDFNAGSFGRWSLAAGPGTIDSLTGVYVFSGQCPLGSIPVIVRFTPAAGGLPCDCSFPINVIDNPPSSSPAYAVVIVSHGQAATNQINAADPNAGDGLVFSKLSGPGTAASNGDWSYPTGCADVAASPRAIQIKTADAFGSCNPGPLADTCEFQLIVTNASPAITNCPTDVLPADTGSAFFLQLTAVDADFADAGSLLYNLVSGPVGFSVSSSGLVRWTPSGSHSGLRSATVQVRDLCGGNSGCQLNFAVSIRKGDLNADGWLSGTDLVLLLQCILLGQPPPVGAWACDLDCNGLGSAADLVRLINAIFQEAPFPC